ncbi:MAG: FeoB-associated Cys-rich membrane protein [Clostridia bacterium]|nr:FeoB-associated Cys-rich membrane protein [Clostridia bacterium]
MSFADWIVLFVLGVCIHFAMRAAHSSSCCAPGGCAGCSGCKGGVCSACRETPESHA